MTTIEPGVADGTTTTPQKRTRAAAATEPADNMTNTSVSMPTDLYTQIQKRADIEERTITVVMRRLLRDGMKGWSPEDSVAE